VFVDSRQTRTGIHFNTAFDNLYRTNYINTDITVNVSGCDHLLDGTEPGEWRSNIRGMFQCDTTTYGFVTR
jgi:hypothetical protein